MRRASSMWVLALAILLPAAGARAAEADTMSVSGNITTNNNCSLSVSNGGAIDYGVILVNTLPQTGALELPLKTMQVTILCSTPSLFGLALEDMRGDPDAATRSLTLAKDRNGLRMAHYLVGAKTAATVNGAAGFLVMWVGGSIVSAGCCWYADDEPWGVNALNDVRGFNQGGNTLIPVTSAQFEFDIDASVYGTNHWTFDDAQALDGMFVMELFYM